MEWWAFHEHQNISLKRRIPRPKLAWFDFLGRRWQMPKDLEGYLVAQYGARLVHARSKLFLHHGLSGERLPGELHQLFERLASGSPRAWGSSQSVADLDRTAVQAVMMATTGRRPRTGGRGMGRPPFRPW